MAWFDYRDGCIVVKNPDEEIRRKMYFIASALGALVQGDEGERYDESGSEVRMGGDDASAEAVSRPWR